MAVPKTFRPKSILAALAVIVFLALASMAMAQGGADASEASGAAGASVDEDINDIMSSAPHSGAEAPESPAPAADPVLERALNHLSRAIVLKRAGDTEPAIAEFLKAVEISPKVTSYNDEGIILEIIGRYLSQSKNRAGTTASDSEDENGSGPSNPSIDKKKVQTLMAEITDLNGKIADLEREISSARDEFEEKEKDLAGQIEKLQEELKDADHMRAVYKGRWLRLKDND